MITTPFRIAHRGDSTTAPENTFEAVKTAVDFGCKGVEIDVRLTKDNKIVLMHDEYIDRMVFNGKENKLNIKLRDLNWSEVIKYKIP
ncbi:MAG: glycerophosphodiester phosphodiesterase, partial [Spirochaetales bacterium]|nr:glycerophosphodiester phosphodiesterase [Spirochaetales bacterium]